MDCWQDRTDGKAARAAGCHAVVLAVAGCLLLAAVSTHPFMRLRLCWRMAAGIPDPEPTAV